MIPKILITGFRPKGCGKDGISEKAALTLLSSYPGASSLIMPIEWRSAQRLLLNKMAKEKPEIVMGLGYLEQTYRLTLEPVLYNHFYGTDDKDKRPPAPYVVKNAQKLRMVDLPFKQIIECLDCNDIPVKINKDADLMGYLCGYVAYLSRYYADMYCDKKAITLFVHIPSPQKLDSQITIQGLKLIIDFLIELRSGNQNFNFKNSLKRKKKRY